jgi:2'-5' RNA ligase
MAREEQQRLFFAVLANRAILDEAIQAQMTLYISGADVKWVDPGIMHFTLKFLGDTPESRITALVRVAGEVARETAPFTVEVQGLGIFLDRGRPQVIWAGCTAGKDEFATLGQRLDAALAAAELAEPERRPFMPHMTLGRLRQVYREGWPLELTEAIVAQAARDLGPLSVDRFLLVRSKLEPQGPAYSVVETFELGASPGSI